MGKYLDIARAEKVACSCDQSDKSDQRYRDNCTAQPKRNQQDTFGRFGRFGRTYTALEQTCPAYVSAADWQQAVEDGRRFLARWSERAEALGWSDADLFGLHQPPTNTHPSYRRMSRYDCTGLCWLLRGREVVVLTESTAAIRHPSGSVTIYRRFNKPPLGPLGDSLDDFQ
jgi:hypothetical protein